MSVCVIGALNLDLVARVGELPRPGETVMGSALSRHPGGKGLNQAVAAARAGAEVRLVGCVGADEPAEVLLGFLAGEGVDVEHVGRDAAIPTGHALITVSESGQNCIVVIAGANLAMPSPAAAATSGIRVLLAQLETAIAPVAALFAAELPGCIKVLNAAPALTEGAALFTDCDVLIVNETELAAYAGLAALSEDLEAVAKTARSLLIRPDQSAVVTLGAHGALVVDASDRTHVPGRPASAVDTVGAGDCFCGVLAAALDEGLSLADAVARANLAASIAVTRKGAAEAMPRRAEILAALH